MRNVENAHRLLVSSGVLGPSAPFVLVVSPGFAIRKLAATNSFGVSAMRILRKTLPPFSVEVVTGPPDFRGRLP